MIKHTFKKIKRIFKHIRKSKKNTFKPLYKLLEIYNEHGEYSVLIKIINRNITFSAKPEEILANDFLVDRFLPRDIRSLTYLGYLGINGPKYEILAQKLSQTEKTIFVLRKKGDKNVILKTADQIIQETNVILSMSSQDAKTIGYTVATESVVNEKKQKQELLEDQSTFPKAF